MKMKRVFVAILAVAIIATGMIGNKNSAMATSGTSKDGPAIVINDKDLNLIAKPGETSHIKLPVTSTGGFLADPEVLVTDKNQNSPFKISKPTIATEYGSFLSSIYLDNTTVYVEFDIKVSETAQIGNYSFTLTINGRKLANSEEECSPSLDFGIKIMEEKAPAQLAISNVASDSSCVGSDTNLNFIIKNEGEITARNTYIAVNYDQTGISKRYAAKNVKLGDIEPGKEKNVILPITIDTLASLGKKELPVTFTYKNADGAVKTDNDKIIFNVKENEASPSVDIESVIYKGELKPGKDFILTASVKNYGSSEAENIKVSLDTSDASCCFIKNYFTDAIDVNNLKKGSKSAVTIPVTITNTAPAGPQALKIKISYQDKKGVSYSKIKTVYPQIIAVAAEDKPNIVVSNVKQNPSQPMAGQNMEVSFDLENRSKVDITELKVGLANLNGTTFIPVESKPYQYIEKLAAGAKTRITIPLLVSKSIVEGLNNLTVKYDYNGGGTGTVDIPILNVKNDLGSKSKPKLIISKYSKDVEELKAGKTFNFIFDIYNTHSAVAAKNITVTVTQPDNIFTVTQGSNSFFINKIEAGETVQKSLEMKVKSDAKTSAYKINIKIEYEYDGMLANPETGQTGETRTEELSLMAIENARPVVNNVNVYSNEGNISVGGSAMVSFEFYNMGKSPLNNVRASVEGDFTKTSGGMQYIGNVAEGSSQYVEMECTPNVEGTAKGKLKITYEDSNGDEVSFMTDFETQVSGAQTFDPGKMDGGIPAMNPDAVKVKKAILPVWLFVIIQVVIFIIFVPVTRKIVINSYKKKMRKKEEEKI